MKAWYEAIGLKAGPILPPVENVAPARATEIAAHLSELGVA
jgi:4-hydroxy-tetrahydrodipicolinate synthase